MHGEPGTPDGGKGFAQGQRLRCIRESGLLGGGEVHRVSDEQLEETRLERQDGDQM